MLASRGYAVLSLPFYAYKDLPRGMPSELELEYFEEACQYVMEQPNVIPDRWGIKIIVRFIEKYITNLF